MKKPTERQLEILTFIAMYEGVRGMSCAYADICQAFNITFRPAYDHVGALKRKGLLKQTAKGLGRVFKITPAGQKALNLEETDLALDINSMELFRLVPAT